MRNTIRKDLSRELPFPQKKANKIMNATIDIIVEELLRGSQVKLKSFGTFSIRHQRSRMGRDYYSGKDVMIPPLKSISFKASHDLKKHVAACKKYKK